jgi:hypothetical protein
MNGTYRSEIYSSNFENCAKEKLIPNLIEKSVTILDYEPSHFLQGEKLQANTR